MHLTNSCGSHARRAFAANKVFFLFPFTKPNKDIQFIRRDCQKQVQKVVACLLFLGSGLSRKRRRGGGGDVGETNWWRQCVGRQYIVVYNHGNISSVYSLKVRLLIKYNYSKGWCIAGCRPGHCVHRERARFRWI